MLEIKDRNSNLSIKPKRRPKKKFRVGYYYTVLNMAIQTVEERFQYLEQYNSVFDFLYDV